MAVAHDRLEYRYLLRMALTRYERLSSVAQYPTHEVDITVAHDRLEYGVCLEQSSCCPFGALHVLLYCWNIGLAIITCESRVGAAKTDSVEENPKRETEKSTIVQRIVLPVNARNWPSGERRCR